MQFSAAPLIRTDAHDPEPKAILHLADSSLLLHLPLFFTQNGYSNWTRSRRLLEDTPRGREGRCAIDAIADYTDAGHTNAAGFLPRLGKVVVTTKH